MSETKGDVTKEQIYDSLRKWFGYKEFRGKQYDAIKNILCGNDVVVLMPTGGGKSLCYQIPPLVKNGITIVISPLIALMQDQLRELQQRKISCAYLSSAQTSSEYRAVMSALQRPECSYRLLFVTPERMQVADFVAALQSLNTRGRLVCVAVDEAHCISTWGHDFRGAYRSLSSLRDIVKDVPIVALSATATSSIVKDIKSQLGIPSAVVIAESFNRPNIFYSIVPTANVDKHNHLLYLLSTHSKESIIIYVRKKDDAEELQRYIEEHGSKAAVYHGSLPNKEKEQALKNWIHDVCHVIVATIAFGMGINKNNVRLVIHWNIPGSLYNYYQESGRAGRDGKDSESVIYYSKEDVNAIAYAIKRDEDEKRVERQMAELQEVVELCTKNDCRRKRLLKYFQEEKPKTENAKCCDYCQDPKKSEEMKAVVRRIHSTSSILINSTANVGFQSARDLYQKEEKKPMSKSSFYHVDAGGKLVENSDEEEQEDRGVMMMRMIREGAERREKEGEKKRKEKGIKEMMERKKDGLAGKEAPQVTKMTANREEEAIGLQKKKKAEEGGLGSQKEKSSKKRAAPDSEKKEKKEKSAAELLLEKITKDIESIRAYYDVSAKQRQKCIQGLSNKYRVALSPFLPDSWLACISLQQARAQEHFLIEHVLKEINSSKQPDIRSMFGKKQTNEATETSALDAYKAAFKRVYAEVAKCGKECRVPRLQSINPSLHQPSEKVSNDALLLPTKIRISIMPFFPNESIATITKFIIEGITKDTPGGEVEREAFLQRVHGRIEKTIRKNEPFLYRKEGV